MSESTEEEIFKTFVFVECIYMYQTVPKMLHEASIFIYTYLILKVEESFNNVIKLSVRTLINC